jgi:Fur family ferric uptake transcriptional regulator
MERDLMPYLTRDELIQRLRASGLRVTQQRLGVFDALVALGRHATPEEVAEHLRRDYPTISLNTVYDTLETLATAGIIRRADVMAGPLRYDPNTEPHHHLVCRLCGDQVDVDCAGDEAPCLEPSDDHGFIVERAEVTFFGICPACQQRGSVTAVRRP